MIIAIPASQPAKAVVVSTVIIGTVIAAMAAAGIGLSVSGITSTQLSDWVSGKLQSWATSLGGSVEDHINGNLITTTASGIISIGTSAANSIAQFLGWLQTDESLTDNSQNTIIESSTTVLGYQYAASPFTFELTHYGDVFQCNEPGVLGCVIGSPNRLEFFMISQNPTWLYTNYESTFQATGISLGNGYYYRTTGSNPVTSTRALKPQYYPYWHSFTVNDFVSGFSPSEIGSTGSLVIDTGVITIPTIDTNAQDKWFLDVGADPGTTIETATDGVIADTISGDLTVSGEVAEEEPEFEITGPVAVTGITEVFPFCIPFDLAAFATCLVADPVCPHFEIPFVIPGLVDYTFVIDLSAFETVAQILRTMELLLFCVGLAFVTRKLLRS